MKRKTTIKDVVGPKYSWANCDHILCLSCPVFIKLKISSKVSLFSAWLWLVDMSGRKKRRVSHDDWYPCTKTHFLRNTVSIKPTARFAELGLRGTTLWVSPQSLFGCNEWYAQIKLYKLSLKKWGVCLISQFVDHSFSSPLLVPPNIPFWGWSDYSFC